MKQMQCNALNFKTAAKQIWLYFIRRTTRPGRDTTTNLQTVSNTQKVLGKFSYPKNPRIENFTPPPSKKKNPSIIPVAWNPEYRLWGSRQYPYPKSNIILSLSDKTYK